MFEHKMYLILILNQFHIFTSLHLEFYPCENHITNNGLINVNCQHRHLAKIPQFKSLLVISLNMNGNHIHQVKSDAFSGIPNLKHLTLMWNCVPDVSKEKIRPSCYLKIDPDAFVGLEKLSSLHLAGNSLKTIPPLPKQLAVLGLEFNNIFHIDQPLGTPHLKEMLLNKNCFYANPCYRSYFIHPRVFQDLPELLNLTLSYNNVTLVPPHLPRSLESLDLGENKITTISKESFVNLTRLRHLNLGWNCQRCDHASEPCFPCPNNQSLDLHQGAFSDQRDSLISLSLRGNSIRTLPLYLFARLHKLQELDLSDNLLAYTIQNGTFYEELQSVASLNLLYNYEPLNTFSELILSPSIEKMTALRELFLSGFFFKVLSNHSLAPLSKLPRLESLELRMNFICSVNMSALSQLRSLRWVGLSQNMLAFNPCISFCTSKAIPKYLSHRGHRHIEGLGVPNAEVWLNSVQESKRDDCPLYYSLWLFKKQICWKNLMFDLSQNSIPWLNESIFTGMEKAVCIDLSYNYISQTLNGQQFSRLSKLAYLNMAHNRIDLYSDKAFQEISDTLQVLDLSNNEFHFVMKGMGHRFTFISHLSSLQMLSLANNHIGLRISTTLTSASLKYLVFSGNRLDIMWDSRRDEYMRFFQGLTKLTHLDISENHLKSFSPKAFVNLPPTLRVLRVDSNMLSYFPWGNISVLKDLCYLNLSGNMLSFLPNNHLELKLISLDLSHNRLTVIPKTFFSHAKNLKNLMLNHNQLKFLDVHALPWSFRKGSTICASGQHQNASCKLVLHANPFACSCVTSEFAKFLRETVLNVPQLTTHIHCAYPQSLAGVNVLSIDLRSCQDIFGSVAFLCTSLLTLAATIIPLLKHLYGWDLWYCVQILWTGHKGHTPANGHTSDSHYDAFVVFDTSNKAVREWIYKEMIERLENRGRWNFRLCLEERDWLPGVSCIENLHKAVYNSRKTVFVLTSPGGYSEASGVVKQAFLLVQQRLLDEKLDVAVLVLLDLLFPKFKYLQMRKRLCRKSVLSWPRNPRAQPLFWNNLSAALLSDNMSEYNKNVTESFL
ncbi:toll-like receptor 9 [Triplophysa rosa]|uniref:Toll-like receptor 9 n=1 Tax=Triplophysa rosa TaxID=992332 RepID=A0A977J633_TRIRA|nr:toll-like receptor 9 [Triplophysa rosa]KAI7789923.1 toll-like receptor 9 [Triplophysa rosa]UWV86659.1 Toll-like receptor 9 [Triplophysa rosa]